MDIARKYCKSCENMVDAERPTPKRILHLLLSLLTLGFWIIIWILAEVSRKPYRCRECGRTKLSNEAPKNR